MIYGDDQCEECGAVRVAGSNLCPQCLVRQLDREKRKKQVLQSIIDMRDLEVGQLNGRLNDVLAYGFKKNQENAKLKQHIKEIQKEIERGMEDGKDRKAEDTGL